MQFQGHFNKFLTKTGMCQQILVKLSNIKFNENLLSRQTEWHGEANRHTSATILQTIIQTNKKG
jgi:hypothetical protein